MNATAQAMDHLTLNVTQEIHVSASLDTTFEALLKKLGRTKRPAMENPCR